MSFGEHLDELRRRLILAIAAPLPLAVIFFTFAEPIRTWMCLPLVQALRSNRLPVQLQTLNPVETVLLDMKLGIVLALVVSAPWILWQVWAFVAPGLHRHERRFVQFLLPASALLTATGVVLLFYLVLPLMLTMLVSFGVGSGPFDLPHPTPQPAAPSAATTPSLPDGAATDGAATDGASPQPSSPAAAPPAASPALSPLPASVPVLAEHPAAPRAGDLWIKVPENLLCVAIASGDQLEILGTSLGRNTLVVQQYRLSEYIDFVLMMTASIALAFQMPLVILLLGWLGIVDLRTLRSHRKHALFACAILAAVLTPSADFISMMLALVPLYLLYELGIILLQVLPASRIAGRGPPQPSRPPTPVPAAGSVARRSEQDEA